eukprot:Platyproteum_vivax@DN13934_c0_g1_i1.p1
MARTNWWVAHHDRYTFFRNVHVTAQEFLSVCQQLQRGDYSVLTTPTKPAIVPQPISLLTNTNWHYEEACPLVSHGHLSTNRRVLPTDQPKPFPPWKKEPKGKSPTKSSSASSRINTSKRDQVHFSEALFERLRRLEVEEDRKDPCDTYKFREAIPHGKSESYNHYRTKKLYPSSPESRPSSKSHHTDNDTTPKLTPTTQAVSLQRNYNPTMWKRNSSHQRMS